MTLSDFYPFLPTSEKEWLSQVKKDLKGKDFEKTLVKKIWGEINQLPFYTFESLSQSSLPMEFHMPLDIPGMPPRIWSNLVCFTSISEKSTNKEILDDLEQGVDGIILELDEDPNWEILLDRVLLPYIHIYLKPTKNPGVIFLSFLKYIQSLNLSSGSLKGGFLWSPSGSMFESNGDFEKKLELAKHVISDWAKYSNFFPICIDFSRYRNSGGSGIQELQYGFGEMVELTSQLSSKGIDSKTCLENTMIHSSIANEFFPEIAKLKSIRLLFSKIAFQFGEEVSPEKLHLIASTSTWDHSFLDKNSNLVRQTYESMAGILGGTNGIWVTTAGLEKASSLENRIAKNISLILKEESYFDKVKDPAAGSYYLESLQSSICNTVKSKIAELESEGGWIQAFNSRKIHQSIKKTRTNIQNQILQGSKIKVGANKYKPGEKLAENNPTKKFEESDFELKPTHATYLLEKNQE